MRLSIVLCWSLCFLRSGARAAGYRFIPAVLWSLVLWASIGVSGVIECPLGAGPAEPGVAPIQEPEDGDDAVDEPENSDLPLQVDRLVPLDMTEGSWISLDVSPDGETIVFDFLGDLFTIPIAGGDATQLTSGMAFDAQRRLSPDGSRVVYTSDADGGQNVWVMGSDGSDPVQISKGASNRGGVARVDARRQLRGGGDGRLPERYPPTEAVPRGRGRGAGSTRVTTPNGRPSS